MLGRKERDQLEFFVCGSLRDLIPVDPVLRRVDRVLDLSWLPSEVADLYADGFGRLGIDPEAAVRLMLAGFLQGIVHDRRLMRDASVNLAINLDEDDRLSRKTGKFKKLCVTDPDASMATSAAGRQLLPSYKQHTSVDEFGIWPPSVRGRTLASSSISKW